MRPLPAVAAFAALCVLPACGAGLITGITASNRNGTPARPPQLSVPELRFPLVSPASAATVFRTVVVTNAQLQGAGTLSVELRSLGVRAEQGSPVIVSSQGASTVVGFLLRTEVLAAAAGDPTAQDLQGELAVLVNGREVAPPVAIVLLRQPTARLVTPAGATEVFLSPLGGSDVTLAVSGLRAQRVEELQVLVTTDDPAGSPAGVTRPCTNLTLSPGIGDEQHVAADVPGNTFSGSTRLVVVDNIAGLSTEVTNAFYRPEVTSALPGQGPTTGGSLVTLIGRALVPLDFSTQPARQAFERVQLSFRKGGREVTLPAQDLRPLESDLDRLVFTMPASADGRPGEVGVVLRVVLGQVAAEVIAPNVFTFSNPQPVFGPRGAVLDRVPVASTLLRLESAPGGGDAPDVALLQSEAGVAFLQLLMAQENGMFIRFGAPRRIGDPERPDERDPQDLCAEDFDGDGVPDLLAVNRGSQFGVHHLIQGQPRPEPPLGPVVRLADDPGYTRCIAADLDDDGVHDFILLPGSSAPPGARPHVWLARPAGPGMPGFLRTADLPVRIGPADAIAVEDLDGDLKLDAAVATGGAAPRLDVVYGVGDGSFVPGDTLDLVVPGYTPDVASGVVGLHPCGDSEPRPLAIVFSGTQAGGATPATVAVAQPAQPRTYTQPVAAGVLLLPTEPIGTSLVADLDGDDIVELILGVRGDVQALPLILGRWTGATFEAIPGAVEAGAERLLSITALHFGTAFPADPVRGTNEVRAVFALHESMVDNVRERRLSTLLVNSGPSLLAPDAGGQIPVQARALVGGSFQPISIRLGGTTRDLALGTINEVRLLVNDGAGGFFRPGPILPASGIVPETLARVQVTPEFTGGDSLAFLTVDGRLSVWTPDIGRQRSTIDLRTLTPRPVLETIPVAARSRIRCQDVDGDGLLDLIVMMAFDLAQPGEGDALLFLLRGKPGPTPTEFPFYVPSSATSVAAMHGNSSSFVLADFVPTSPSGVRALEAAVAVPAGSTPQSPDGNHVRFYRWLPGATPADDRFERSSATGPQVLLTGDAPTQLAAADFDNNGTDDLLVAAAGDSTLRLFLNNGMPGSEPGEVNLAAFRESLTSPRPLAPGNAMALRLGDINGDGNVDALVATESLLTPRSSAVAFYLSDGAGSFGNPVFVAASRLGDRPALLSIDLSDFNGDGQLDLGAAWNTVGAGDRNVRVLFGGSR